MRCPAAPTLHLAALAAAWLAGCGTGPIDAVSLGPAALSSDLVAHWSFDEGTGTVVHDDSGHGHDGALSGSTWSWLEHGRLAGALHLEQGDYVAVDGFPNATPGWTVAVWVQFASANVGIDEVTVISTEKVFTGGWEINLLAPSGEGDLRYHFGFWTGPTSVEYAHYECKGCVHPDQWQHLAVVVDGAAGTMAFYLDGALQGRQSIPRAISPGVSTLYMGRWSTPDPARLLVGSLDDVAIWSRALVSEEIGLLTQAAVP
jgi:hypothetical protein